MPEEANVADIYKNLTDAEKQASLLEGMLDALDTKMDTILKDIEQNKTPIIDENLTKK